MIGPLMSISAEKKRVSESRSKNSLLINQDEGCEYARGQRATVEEYKVKEESRPRHQGQETLDILYIL